MSLFLAIDAGGTKTRAVISTIEGNEPRILAEGLSPGSNLAEVGLTTCLARLRQAALGAVALLPVAVASSSTCRLANSGTCPITFERVWLGISGVDSPPDVRRLTPALEDFFGISVTIQNDALLLASPLLKSTAEGGILAVGGTGSVCLAVRRTKDGQVEYLGRRGGLGFLLGDEGSAYHVGRTLLRLVLYAEDAGTLDHTSPFIRALLDYWKIEGVDQLLERTYSVDPTLDARDAVNDRKLRISESCRLIVSHAFPDPHGTRPCAPLALEAVRHSTQELAKDIASLVTSGRTRLDPSTAMLCLGGSLVGHPPYRALLVDSLATNFGIMFGAGVVHVADAAADGARALAALSLVPSG